ncbi:MAG: twin transmembrane helix small protein [Candidatus Pelagibacterales bacterium]|jgi:hypothetical protein|tara:strand:+ start:3654 stop:3854 length:201 start_codon:yes stop_codon:yes gene_type:complete
MPNVFYYLLIPIAIAAVTVVLLTGIFSMLKGGKFNKQYSNKLMRLRILLQFIAIVIIMISIYIASN